MIIDSEKLIKIIKNRRDNCSIKIKIDIMDELLAILRSLESETELIEQKFPKGKKFRYIIHPDDYENPNRIFRKKICEVIDYAYPKGHICYNAISNSIEVKFEGQKNTIFVEQEELKEI